MSVVEASIYNILTVGVFSQAEFGVSVPELLLAEGVAIDRMSALEPGRTSIQALVPLNESVSLGDEHERA
jgi:hypothetical protein